MSGDIQAVENMYQLQAAKVGGDKVARGLDQGWVAPVGIFDAAAGFGEESWIEAIPVTVLATRLQGAAVTWCCGKQAGRTSGASSTVLQCKGTPNDSRAAGPVRFAQVYLQDALIDRVADAIRPGAVISGALRDDLVFVPDRDLDHGIASYVRATASGASALELESKVILLVSHLLRTYHGFGEATRSTGGLAPWQLKRACEAMDAHLDEDIGLDMLAEIAGCSPTHFSRAFKQSTGMPPFQWLLERRIERAQALLADHRVSLAEVALAVGFAAQPQFTTAFRRVTGATPGAWRRDRLA